MYGDRKTFLYRARLVQLGCNYSFIDNILTWIARYRAIHVNEIMYILYSCSGRWDVEREALFFVYYQDPDAPNFHIIMIKFAAWSLMHKLKIIFLYSQFAKFCHSVISIDKIIA